MQKEVELMPTKVVYDPPAIRYFIENKLAQERPETSRHLNQRVIALCRSEIQASLDIFPFEK